MECVLPLGSPEALPLGLPDDLPLGMPDMPLGLPNGLPLGLSDDLLADGGAAELRELFRRRNLEFALTDITDPSDITAKSLEIDAQPHVKEYTLVQVLDGARVLLGMKKSGFGCGKLNGFGGKVEPSDESVAAAAARELAEESGLHAPAGALEFRGVLLFAYRGAPKLMRVHLYVVRLRDCSGEPTESEEMAPRWFASSAIPYEQMWADDEHWLDRVLAGESVEVRFTFSADQATILQKRLRFSEAK